MFSASPFLPLFEGERIEVRGFLRGFNCKAEISPSLLPSKGKGVRRAKQYSALTTPPCPVHRSECAPPLRPQSQIFSRRRFFRSLTFPELPRPRVGRDRRRSRSRI